MSAVPTGGNAAARTKAAAAPVTGKEVFMDYLLILAGVLTVMILVSHLISGNKKEKKVPGGNCRNCPEFRYCGGGKPRCARRNETLK